MPSPDAVYLAMLKTPEARPESKAARVLLAAVAAGYRADSEGNVYSPKGRVLRVWKSPYLRFVAWLDRKTHRVPVHRLVAYQKFGAVIFAPGVQVRHLDNNHLNNRWSNIGVGSQADNSRDVSSEEWRRRNARSLQMAHTACTRCNPAMAARMKELRESGLSWRHVGALTGFSDRGAEAAVRRVERIAR